MQFTRLTPAHHDEGVGLRFGTAISKVDKPSRELAQDKGKQRGLGVSCRVLRSGCTGRQNRRDPQRTLPRRYSALVDAPASPR
jgi:hypothetical protein